MEPNAFVGWKKMPTDAELAKALGKAIPVWEEALRRLEEIAPDREWHSYSIKAGWAMKLKKKDRVIVYFSPRRDSFQASFALGDRAVKAALQGELPEAIVNLIQGAKKYAEGTAVRIEVRGQSDIEVIEKIAIIKAAN